MWPWEPRAPTPPRVTLRMSHGVLQHLPLPLGGWRLRPQAGCAASGSLPLEGDAQRLLTLKNTREKLLSALLCLTLRDPGPWLSPIIGGEGYTPQCDTGTSVPEPGRDTGLWQRQNSGGAADQPQLLFAFQQSLPRNALPSPIQQLPEPCGCHTRPRSDSGH